MGGNADALHLNEVVRTQHVHNIFDAQLRPFHEVRRYVSIARVRVSACACGTLLSHTTRLSLSIFLSVGLSNYAAVIIAQRNGQRAARQAHHCMQHTGVQDVIVTAAADGFIGKAFVGSSAPATLLYSG